MTEKNFNQEEIKRANAKSKKRKEARDRMLANKTVEKGLLIVHTGKGKGKSTAAFGVRTGHRIRGSLNVGYRGLTHSPLRCRARVA